MAIQENTANQYFAQETSHSVRWRHHEMVTVFGSNRGHTAHSLRASIVQAGKSRLRPARGFARTISLGHGAYYWST